MVGITLTDRNKNPLIRKQTKVTDVLKIAPTMKMTWPGRENTKLVTVSTQSQELKTTDEMD